MAAFAGQLVLIRFNYHFAGGSRYTQTSDGVGWYVDAITFEDIATVELVEEATLAPGANYVFSPPSAGTSLLVARPRNLDRWWPTGLPVELEAIVGLGYETWAHNWENAANLPAGSLAGSPMDDANGHGAPNIVAYALALDPSKPAVDQLPRWVVTETGGGFQYTVETSATGASVTPEISTDLQTWHPVGAAALGFDSEDQLFSSIGTVETRRIVFPNTTPPTAFFRVRVDFP
ncbi:MAG: hypothetical protein EA353_11995 [Puniceicoccaceae bacterium]|nr:MAG: hypothetical protein EA353_11995 [Puniceicoccaceae bacterium]